MAVETGGYIVRCLAVKNETNIGLYVIQTLLILVAPALFAASIYMILGRLILQLRAEAYTPVRPSWLTKIFVGGDVLSFLIQMVGAGSLSKNFNRAKSIILVGLILQLASFGIFLIAAVIFHYRMTRNPTAISYTLDGRGKMRWRGVMYLLYLTGGLIFIRSIFRFIEFTGGSDSIFMTSEAYFYICDSSLMFIVLAVLGYFHPSDYVMSKKEIMQLHGEEMS